LPSERTINGIEQEFLISKFLKRWEQKRIPLCNLMRREKVAVVVKFFSVRDSDEKEWVMGLKDMIDKRSSNCLKTLKVIT